MRRGAREGHRRHGIVSAWATDAAGAVELSLDARPEGDRSADHVAQACDHLRLGDPTSAEAVAQQDLVERMIRAAVGEVQLLRSRRAYPEVGARRRDDGLAFMLPGAVAVGRQGLDDAGTVIDPASYSVVPTSGFRFARRRNRQCRVYRRLEDRRRCPRRTRPRCFSWSVLGI